MNQRTCPCDSWVAIIAYLLIAKIKADYKSPYSITEVATLIRISAFEKVDLRETHHKAKELNHSKTKCQRTHFI